MAGGMLTRLHVSVRTLYYKSHLIVSVYLHELRMVGGIGETHTYVLGTHMLQTWHDCCHSEPGCQAQLTGAPASKIISESCNK